MIPTFRTTYARLGALATALTLGGLPAVTHAIDVGPLQPAGSTDISTASDLNQQLRDISASVINTILLVSGILGVIYLVYSGVQYITSAGDPNKAKNARQGIINAVVGIIVIVAAFFIVRLAVGVGTTASNLN